jgi:hypothetical protein
MAPTIYPLLYGESAFNTILKLIINCIKKIGAREFKKVPKIHKN